MLAFSAESGPSITDFSVQKLIRHVIILLSLAAIHLKEKDFFKMSRLLKGSGRNFYLHGVCEPV
jgi:hypothetical protein